MSNSLFRRLLEQPATTEIEVPIEYRTFVAGGFKDVEGCLFFREFALGQRTAAALPHFGDATGYEASVNGHHLKYYLPPDAPRDTVTLAHVTLACARFLARRLRSASNEPCRVIVTVSANDATIRFHKLREDEPTWLSSNLEGYEEAVGYLDTTDEDLDR
jgi:hypothetical protein